MQKKKKDKKKVVAMVGAVVAVKGPGRQASDQEQAMNSEEASPCSLHANSHHYFFSLCLSFSLMFAF